MKSFAFSWDWKSQPDIGEILDASQNLWRQGLPVFHYDIDTGCDEFGLLITDKGNMTKDQAYAEWERVL